MSEIDETWCGNCEVRWPSLHECDEETGFADALAALHAEHGSCGECAECGQAWPCNTVTLLTETIMSVTERYAAS